MTLLYADAPGKTTLLAHVNFPTTATIPNMPPNCHLRVINYAGEICAIHCIHWPKSRATYIHCLTACTLESDCHSNYENIYVHAFGHNLKGY